MQLLQLPSSSTPKYAWSVAAVLFVMGTAAGMINVHIGAWAMQRIDDTVHR